MPKPEIIEIQTTDRGGLFETHPIDGHPTLLPAYSDWITSRVKRAPSRAPILLRIRGESPASKNAAPLEQLRAHFLRAAERESESLRSLFRYGCLFSLIGFSFLLLLLSLSATLRPKMESNFLRSLAESFSIFGTVALWKPAEILLYEWIPLYRRVRLLRRVAKDLTAIEYE